MSSPTRNHRTRRELLRGSTGGPLPGDADRLARLLEHEQLAARLYGLALRSGDISPRGERLLRVLRRQEHAHAQALAMALGTQADTARLQLGEPATSRQLEAGLARLRVSAELGGLRSERDWFALLEALENGLEGAYYEAIGGLRGAAPATLAAQILASEAQHQTLLFRLRHPGDISLAVATGLVVGNAPPSP